MQFYDAATGKIDFHAWQDHDARVAKTFADKTDQFLTNDQVGRAFLVPQLHRIEAQVYMTKYPSYDITSLMPVNEDGDMWDVGTLFYSMDQVGRAEFLSGKGFDMPYANVTTNQYTRGFNLMGIGYEWTVQEMERAAMLGRALSADKAAAAVKAADRTIFNIALTGRLPGDATSEKGWTGLLNDANVPSAQVAADGTGSSRLFSAKTADQIVRDVNSCINAVETATLETFQADTLILPTTVYNYLANTRMSGNTDTTILNYLQSNNILGQGLTILKHRFLETAGTGGTTRMIAYANTAEVLRFHLPGRHRFLPAFQKGSMTYEVGGIMNVGGTEIRIPNAVAYRDSF